MEFLKKTELHSLKYIYFPLIPGDMLTKLNTSTV